MNGIKCILLAAASLFIITACATTEWKPTTFYTQDNIQTTTPAEGEHIVIIYTTKWCYWCKVAKKWMIKQSITYVVFTIKVFHHKSKIKQSNSLLKICAF